MHRGCNDSRERLKKTGNVGRVVSRKREKERKKEGRNERKGRGKKEKEFKRDRKERREASRKKRKRRRTRKTRKRKDGYKGRLETRDRGRGSAGYVSSCLVIFRTLKLDEGFSGFDEKHNALDLN